MGSCLNRVLSAGYVEIPERVVNFGKPLKSLVSLLQ